MIRVIDLTQHVAGPFATMALAELGADVIKVEPPGAGDPRRAGSACDPEDYSFDFLNRRKRGVTLDIRRRRGRELLLRLVAEADAVVEGFAPGTLGKLRLSYRTLRRAKPEIVLTSISNFGQTGPRRDWQAMEFVLQAMGGIVAATGWDDAPPKRLAGHQACHIAGLNAATATLAAVYGVQAGTQGGVHIDLSIQETFAPHWARHIAQYVYSGTGMRREQRTNGRQGFPHTAMAADGWLYILALYAEWETLAYFLGLEQFITHEWSDPAVRAERWDEIEPAFRAAIASRGKYDWFARAAEEGYTFAPIEAPADVLAGPQAAARGFFKPATLLTGRDAPCPGLPFAFDTDHAMPNRAPRLGEHNDEIFGGLLGLDADERAALHAAGII
jgi:crotonobetainyl-CoA:carnitine CoA-transferase CaiB-like acyl-CoA transferase